ncbi:MAG: GNAT family N-acetyltransferase [Paludibacteraceae bacterium]|nr:GNAT family N-acetyltransferase [Paludibacteraceae bacterium]
MTNKELYAQLCEQNTDIPIFMQPWWLDAVCAGKEWDVILVTDRETVLGAMPYLIRKRWGMKYILMPQMTQIGGIWINRNCGVMTQDTERIVCEEIRDRLEAMGLCYYYQHYPIDSPCPEIMEGLGFTIKHRVTYRLNDLSDLDKVIDRFSRNKKRQLQKALSLHAERGLNVEEFYRFHTHCLEQKKKKISYSREFMLVMERKATRQQQGETIAIRNADGVLIAAGFVVWDKNVMHYLIAAQDANYNDTGAMALLVLECIKLAREKGVIFDFEGSMIRGVAAHFKQFGSEPSSYYSVQKYYKWWFAVPYMLYRLFTHKQR